MRLYYTVTVVTVAPKFHRVFHQIQYIFIVFDYIPEIGGDNVKIEPIKSSDFICIRKNENANISKITCTVDRKKRPVGKSNLRMHMIRRKMYSLIFSSKKEKKKKLNLTDIVELLINLKGEKNFD